MFVTNAREVETLEMATVTTAVAKVFNRRQKVTGCIIRQIMPRFAYAIPRTVKHT